MAVTVKKPTKKQIKEVAKRLQEIKERRDNERNR